MRLSSWKSQCSCFAAVLLAGVSVAARADDRIQWQKVVEAGQDAQIHPPSVDWKPLEDIDAKAYQSEPAVEWKPLSDDQARDVINKPVIWNPAQDSDVKGGTLQGESDGESGAALRPPTSFSEAQELLALLKLPSPLLYQASQYPTAFQLAQDDVKIGANFRSYFPPKSIIPNSSTSIYAGWSINFGLTDTTELGVAFNRVDSSGPGKQGPFFVDSATGLGFAEDNIYTLQIQQQLWKNQSQTQAFGAVVSVAFGTRASNFNGDVYTSDEPVPSLQLPFSFRPSKAWQLTFSPTVVFFSQDSALFLHTAPIEDPGSFGTLAGLSANVSYKVNQRITLWSDTFFPVAGNNSINRTTGKPSKEIIYNAGLRYFVNPSLGLDLYASNAQGSMGPIGFTANPDLTAIGTNLVFLFDVAGNGNYDETFKRPSTITPLLQAGFGLYGGGVAPTRTLIGDGALGGQGFNGLIGFGFVNDLDLSLYLGYASGVIDESEQGIAGRIRLLDQYQGDFLTANLVATIGKTNQPFVNYYNDNANQFRNQGLQKTIPLIWDIDSIETGQLWIVTASLPLIYQFSPKAVNSSSLWIAPSAGLAQRIGGLQLLGINFGGSWAVTKELSLIAELGANFGNRGNAFNGNNLTYLLPWSVGLRWNPMGLFGKKIEAGRSYPQIYAYLTNRVGQTPWLSMRVRADNEPAVTIGITIPWGIKALSNP